MSSREEKKKYSKFNPAMAMQILSSIRLSQTQQ